MDVKKKPGKIGLPLLVIFILLLLLVFITVSFAGFAEDQKTETVMQVEKNSAFALDLYRELKDARKGNIFFSPYSISTALAMTYGGARGNTARQMADVLHFPQDHQELHPAFARLEALLNAVQEKGDIRLHAANSLWPQVQ